MKTLLTVFWRGTRTCRKRTYLLIPRLFILSALWVIEPLYGRHAIDSMLLASEGISVDFVSIVGWWLVIYLAINVAQSLSIFLQWEILNNMLAELRHVYYNHVLRLDISHHTKSRGGEIMKKIDNAADVTVDLSVDIIFELPTAILTSIIFYVIGFYISWELAAITLVMVPFYLAVVFAMVFWSRKNYELIVTLWTTPIGRGYDALTNIFSVKSNATEHDELNRMRAIHSEAIKKLRVVNMLWAALEGINYFMLMRILIAGVGIYLLTIDRISLGSLFFFQFAFFRLIVPIEMLQRMLPRWGERISKVRLAEELYAKDQYVRNADDAKIVSPLKGNIVFDNVSFAYENTDALSAINLDIRAGEHIALVGHSGAGKSTFAMLVNRFYDVTDGAILVDGTDLRSLDVHWWRQQIGLVLQDNIMFNDSVLQNIRYGKPDASDEDVRNAAKRASADDFISNLPNGYATEIGERGIRLSGGERQRLAIARAILKNPSIVVLDEATSALDSKTEQAVQEGIAELIKGQTAIIIAHRLSTVRSCDRIAVLDKGKLIACAPHEELLSTCPIYKEMVELQSHGMLGE